MLSAAFLLISGFTMKITRRSPIRVTTAAVQNTDFTPFWISATLVGSADVLALYATANTATAIVHESEFAKLTREVPIPISSGASIACAVGVMDTARKLSAIPVTASATK